MTSSATIQVCGKLAYASQDDKGIQATAGTKAHVEVRMFGQEVVVTMLANGQVDVQVQRVGQEAQKIHLDAAKEVAKGTDAQLAAYSAFKSARPTPGTRAWPMPWEGQPAKPAKASKKPAKPATQPVESGVCVQEHKGASPELLALAKKKAGKAIQAEPEPSQPDLLGELAKKPELLAALLALASKK